MRQKIKIFDKDDMLKFKRELAIRNIMFDGDMVNLLHLLQHLNGELFGLKVKYREMEINR